MISDDVNIIGVISVRVCVEFAKDETLELPKTCTLEYPDAPKEKDAPTTSEKYKRFVVHFSPDEGVRNVTSRCSCFAAIVLTRVHCSLFALTQ